MEAVEAGRAGLAKPGRDRRARPPGLAHRMLGHVDGEALEPFGGGLQCDDPARIFSTFTAAGSTSSSPTTRTRSPSPAAPSGPSAWRTSGCTTAFCRWKARRCRRASATSSPSASCSRPTRSAAARGQAKSCGLRCCEPTIASRSTGRSGARGSRGDLRPLVRGLVTRSRRPRSRRRSRRLARRPQHSCRDRASARLPGGADDARRRRQLAADAAFLGLDLRRTRHPRGGRRRTEDSRRRQRDRGCSRNAAARHAKNRAESDRLRDELAALGVASRTGRRARPGSSSDDASRCAPICRPTRARAPRFSATAIEISAADDYDDDQRAAWASRADDEDAFDARLAGQLTIVATLEGLVVAFASLKGADQLDMLYVDPAGGRQGVGAALVDALVRLPRRAAPSASTAEASDVSKPLFERMKFVAETQPRAARRALARPHHHDQDARRRRRARNPTLKGETCPRTPLSLRHDAARRRADHRRRFLARRQAEHRDHARPARRRLRRGRLPRRQSARHRVLLQEAHQARKILRLRHDQARRPLGRQRSRASRACSPPTPTPSSMSRSTGTITSMSRWAARSRRTSNASPRASRRGRLGPRGDGRPASISSTATRPTPNMRSPAPGPR